MQKKSQRYLFANASGGGTRRLEETVVGVVVIYHEVQVFAWARRERRVAELGNRRAVTLWEPLHFQQCSQSARHCWPFPLLWAAWVLLFPPQPQPHPTSKKQAAVSLASHPTPPHPCLWKRDRCKRWLSSSSRQLCAARPVSSPRAESSLEPTHGDMLSWDWK